MSDLITFTPYLGDTFLTSAVARKIRKLTSYQPSLLGLNDTMAKIISTDWCSPVITGGPYSSFLHEGSLWSDQANIHKSRKANQWHYQYFPDNAYEEFIKSLCYTILKEFDGDTIYTLHNTYPHAMLGRMARNRGINVRGYFLSSNNSLYVETPNGVELGTVWDNQFIGDRISKFATGRELNKEDFRVRHNPSKEEYNTVTLFPSTRGGNHTAGNWEMDVMYLKELGYNVRVAVHTSEKKYFKDPLVSQVHFTDVRELVHLITSSEFIICNDSIAFHLAWYYNKKAVVKMKAGFNREWQPRWVKNNSMYQFIPPSSYFEEEYLNIIQKAILDLQ